MLDRIKNLAHLMKDKKSPNEKFVLMLGAGASLSSGVKPTNEIMDEILASFGRGLGNGSIGERFDTLWRQSSENDRLHFLEPYLNRSPSKGYESLAEIIRKGFIDLILTFNFDRLLESALDQTGFRNYKVIIQGETDTNAFSKLAQAKEPRVKIIKLHGSLASADCFLFSKDEMLNYPQEIESLVRKITGSDIIICGYAFEDMCVLRAFSGSKEDGSIYYVNPSSSAADKIRGFLAVRRSQEKVITGDLGKFDGFFETLYSELVITSKVSKPEEIKKNPFKFLDHYRETDSEWFLGRENLAHDLREKIEKNEIHALHLYGPATAGKTSLVRAGLIAQLDPEKYECTYLRCKSEVQDQLCQELEKKLGRSLQGEDFNKVLSDLKAFSKKCIVLCLDQFERPVFHSAKDKVFDFMVSLTRNSSDNLKPVFICLDNPAYVDLLMDLLLQDGIDRGKQLTRRIEPLDKETLRMVLEELASKARAQLSPETVQRLCEAYNEKTFTLTHVQTLCYYHVRGFEQNGADYEQLSNPGLSVALGSLSEETNLVDLIAELPAEERAMIRSVLKIICDPDANIKSVVEFIKKHFSDLKDTEVFPESVPYLMKK